MDFIQKKLKELAQHQADSSILDAPLLKISPNLAAVGRVAGLFAVGVFKQADPMDETPGVVTVREFGEELGGSFRRYAAEAVENLTAPKP